MNIIFYCLSAISIIFIGTMESGFCFVDTDFDTWHYAYLLMAVFQHDKETSIFLYILLSTYGVIGGLNMFNFAKNSLTNFDNKSKERNLIKLNLEVAE